MANHEFKAIPNYAALKSVLKGISASIDNYTSDAPITSTRALLEESLETKDRESTLYACTEILEWYEKNIQNIESNSFVFNYDTHVANLQRLPAIIEAIEKNPDWFTTSAESCEKPTYG